MAAVTSPPIIFNLMPPLDLIPTQPVKHFDVGEIHPRNLVWIPNMMVLKNVYFFLNMALLSFHVEFSGVSLKEKQTH